MSLALAVGLATLFAGVGFLLRALTGPGAIAAAGVGTAVLAGTGWAGMAALGAFFAGASAIGRLAPDRTAEFGAKGHRRDPWQVLANGGAAALAALVPEAGLWMVTASLAGAAADSWATAVGGWSVREPRHILSGRVVPAGTSGGVTAAGTTGALLGAALVAGAAAMVAPPGTRPAALGGTALALGFAAMLLDSVLGAALQARFHCDACDRPTEQPVHRCGRPTRHTGGLRALGNDGVNAVATVVAALAGALAWRAFGA